MRLFRHCMGRPRNFVRSARACNPGRPSERRSMRILVLILGARRRPYPLLMHVIERTWASIETTGIETLFYVGGRSLRVDRRRLVVPIPDDLANVGRKTIAAFEYALENRRFDLVFRTNCSSYVDLPNLRAYAEG